MKHTDLLEPLALVATAATVIVARLSVRGTTYWLGIEVAGVAAVYAFSVRRSLVAGQVLPRLGPWGQARPRPGRAGLPVRRRLAGHIVDRLLGGDASLAAVGAPARGGLVLATEVLNDPGESGLGTRVVVWMALAAALGMTLNLSRLQRRWGSRAEDVTLRTAVAGGRALVAGLAVAVLLPPLSTQDISGRFFHAETHAPEAGRIGGTGAPGTGPGQAGLLQIGYTEHVVPGGTLHRSTDLVMQVVDDWGGTHYWRGIALYHLANGAWDLGTVPRRSLRFASGQTVEAQGDAGRKTVQARVKVTGAPLTTIFWPGEPQTIDRQTLVLGEPGAQAGGPLAQADASYAAGSSIPTGTTYNVTGTLPVATEADLRAVTGTDPSFVTDLTLDPSQAAGIDPGCAPLAAQLTAGTTTRYDQAKAIEAYLRTLTYRLDIAAPPPGADPVTHFLFRTHTGYCEYFASSMGEMLRSLGIPTRLVNGYGPGTLSATQEQVGVQERQSAYIIHASDAHTWVEVYFPGYGWIPFEPTPDPLYPPIPRGPIAARQPAGSAPGAGPRAGRREGGRRRHRDPLGLGRRPGRPGRDRRPLAAGSAPPRQPAPDRPGCGLAPGRLGGTPPQGEAQGVRYAA